MRGGLLCDMQSHGGALGLPLCRSGWTLLHPCSRSCLTGPQCGDWSAKLVCRAALMASCMNQVAAMCSTLP